MLTTMDRPRYMAFNKGQEAFQLFYERLLIIKEAHTRDQLYLRKNGFHLTSIVNTFNRHYCSGVGIENTRYTINGRITPIYMNLGIYSDTKRNLHRLIAIHLKCNNTRPIDDDIYLVFDHPGYDPGDRGSVVPASFRSTVFRITINEFMLKYYRSSVYNFDTEDYIGLSLKFDEKSYNFKYEPYDGAIEKVYIENDTDCPPLFSHWHLNGTSSNKDGSLLFYDTIHTRVLSGIIPTTFSSRNSYWVTHKEYIAHNRYKKEKNEPTPIYDVPYMMAYEESNHRLLSFLFGLDDMIYVFENFFHLVYKPGRLPLIKNQKDIEFFTNTNTNGKYGKALSIMFDNAGYSTDGPKKGIYKIITTRPDADDYVERYHIINNYINCIDTAQSTVLRLLSPESKWSTKEMEKLIPEIHDWPIDGDNDNDDAISSDDEEPDDIVGLPETVAVVQKVYNGRRIVVSKSERGRILKDLKTTLDEYNAGIDDAVKYINEMNKRIR